MSDITTNTKRATSGMGFDGLSDNDLIRIAAQAIDYAGEISLVHSQIRKDIPVAYCVFGTHFRTETTNADHETTMANVIRNIRDSESIDRSGATVFSFEYDGMTFGIMTEEIYNERVEMAIQDAVDNAEWEVEKQEFPSPCYLNAYMKFDVDQFRRDLEFDTESMVSYYDGVVHEMYWNEWKSGDSTLVTLRQTLYMIRED